MDPKSRAFYVGIDVSKDKLDVAICYEDLAHADPRTIAVSTFEHSHKGTDQLVRLILKHQGLCKGICAESTGVYSRRLQQQLEQSSHAAPDLPAIAIVNPLHIKGTARALGQRDKSDIIDARTIAIHAAQRRPAPTPRSPQYYEKLRALSALREGFLASRIAVHNQLEAACEKQCRAILKKELTHLDKRLAEIEDLIARHIEEHEPLRRDAQLLRSIPSVGPVLATVVLAHFGDLRAWSRRQLAAYAGLYPTEHTSGKSVRGKPHLAKGGGRPLRKALYMPSLRLLHKELGYNKTILERCRQKTHAPMYYVGMAMRKMVLVMRAVVISGRPFDPQLAR